MTILSGPGLEGCRTNPSQHGAADGFQWAQTNRVAATQIEVWYMKTCLDNKEHAANYQTYPRTYV
jgi:hypothetical protein